MTDPWDSTFVPVPRPALNALVPALRAVQNASHTQRSALARLVELADDLCADAVRRLREQGASEAQVERYEQALRTQTAAVTAASDGLSASLVELRAAAREIAGEV